VSQIATGEIVDDPIVSFYAGEIPDSSGRKIEEIWNFNDRQLETVHDFIQWLFPLPTRSAYNPEAPLLTERTAGAFRRGDALRSRLSRSVELMLRFYGLEQVKAQDGSISIEQAIEFPERSRHWLTPNNHNHLRLTRMIESTRLLGLEDYSRGLFTVLEKIALDHPHQVSARTVEFWRSAAGG
jgi:hypothetical protein